MKTLGRSGMHLSPPWLQEQRMQSIRIGEEENPSEYKVVVKALDS
jgi:hypothetical protein